MKRRLVCATITLLVVACSTRTGPAVRVETAATTTAVKSVHRVTLANGDLVKITDGVAILVGADGRMLAQNDRVVREQDPNGICPAGGFQSIEAAGKGFALRNMLCSGWFFIDEIMTFTHTDSGYRLIHFSAEYLDRRTAEPSGQPRVLTDAEFGDRRFDSLDPDDLYRLIE